MGLKPKVPGVGPRDAKIVIVGEAPGENEVKAGEPFVGAAGNLLNTLLANNGILRQRCYITNVIKERPPNNDESHFIQFPKSGRAKPRATQAFLDYVEELRLELQSLNPNIVVAVGNISLYALTGRRGITKWRGSVLPCSLVPGLKVIPVIHPAASFRQYKWRHYISYDLKRVKQHSEFPEIPEDPRTYYLRPTFDFAMDYLDQCARQPLVAFDIEVSKLAVSCISFARTDQDAISIPFSYRGREWFTLQQEAAIWRKISSILSDQRVEKVAQNAMFDSYFLLREYGIITRNLHDTMVAMSLLYPFFEKDLGFITSIFTDMPYYKDEGKDIMRDQHKGMTPAEQEQFWLYNARDSIVLMETLPKQIEELIQIGNYETYRNTIAILPQLLFMFERGIKMNLTRMQRKHETTADTADELEKKIQEVAGYPINPRSPDQLKEYFYENKGYRPFIKDGKPTTDEKALIRLKAKGDKLAALLLDYRKAQKLDSTYLSLADPDKQKLDDDGRLRCSFNPVGTWTGRLSSSKTIYRTGMNMQNQPPAMKQMMLVDQGYVGFTIDLSQAENRVVAFIAPDVAMMRAFEADVDIHAQTAALIFGLPVETIIEYNDNDVKCDLANGRYTHRYWGKRSNHGLNYDLRPRTFALHLQVEESVAKFLYEQYHRAYPGVKNYHRWVQNELRNTMSLRNLYGRLFRFTDRWGHSLFKDAYSCIPQSTVAAKTNFDGIKLIQDHPTFFRPLELLLQVHDSLHFQIPLGIGWQSIARLCYALMESLENPLEFQGRSFSIPTDIQVHPNNFKDGTEISYRDRPPITECDPTDLAHILEEAYYEAIDVAYT